jgi:hypothetical protein
MVLDRQDCLSDLQVLMLSYTAIKYIYSIPLELYTPLITAWVNKKLLERSLKKKEALMLQSGKEPSTKLVRHDDNEELDKFTELLEENMARPPFAGTFMEYATKVLQFGYIAMFSAAFPLGALCSAVANVIELRTDAMKMFEFRRPRYMGAEDIGSWQKVLQTIAWLALFVNVGLIGFTSFELRDNIIIPAYTYGLECKSPTTLAAESGDWAINTTALSYLNCPVNATLNSPPRAADGGPLSWASKCEQTVRECFVNVGGVEWLPGTRYLPDDSSTTTTFIEALRNPNPWATSNTTYEPELLYDQRRSDVCTAWRTEVYIARGIFVVILEHCLLALKLLLGFIIPDKPHWIVKAEARKNFNAENHNVKKKRKSIADMKDEEAFKQEAKLKALKINDEDDATPHDSVRNSVQYTSNV